MFNSSRDEQANRIPNALRRQDDMISAQRRHALEWDEVPEKKAVDIGLIQILAYQLHHNNGGSALENWLEAEKSLKNSQPAVSSFISEGNPNT